MMSEAKEASERVARVGNATADIAFFLPREDDDGRAPGLDGEVGLQVYEDIKGQLE